MPLWVWVGTLIIIIGSAVLGLVALGLYLQEHPASEGKHRNDA